MIPFDYSLCCQTVTLYRMTGGAVSRQVLKNVYLRAGCRLRTELSGKSGEKPFLLIIPGSADIRPADRVFTGIGPEEVDWQLFSPALKPQVYEISYVTPCCWGSEVCHVQAGHKEAL